MRHQRLFSVVLLLEQPQLARHCRDHSLAKRTVCLLASVLSSRFSSALSLLPLILDYFKLLWAIPTEPGAATRFSPPDVRAFRRNLYLPSDPGRHLWQQAWTPGPSVRYIQPFLDLKLCSS